MKVRNGFVSNSSSSSFIILLSNINDRQKQKIYDHIEIAKKIDDDLKDQGKESNYEYYEEWYIEEDDMSMWLYTSMDNFCMWSYLTNEVGMVDEDITQMGDDMWGDSIFDTEEYEKFRMKIRNDKLNKLKDNIDENR